MQDPPPGNGAGELRALYVCYSSLEDPLIQTQVVAYLAGLAERGHTIHLLTFEGRLDPQRRRFLEEDLGRRGIAWHSLRYHKRLSLLATVLDVAVGAARAVRLARRHRLDVIHARNHVPLAMALTACRVTGCRLIFDVRGLMADEYVDAGLWKKGGLPYRLTQWVQRLGLRRADGMTIRTEAVRPILGPTKAGDEMTFVIPACVDLGQIERQRGEREAVRAELGLGERPVMAYVGKFTGWYMEREMAGFFAAARNEMPGLLFLVVTQADPEPMLRELALCGIESEDYRLLSSAPEELGRYLAAADFGISFIRPCFSKISSSPTKIGEYLAAGLPVLSSTGIGDVDALLEKDSVGVLVTDFSQPGYRAAVEAVCALCADPGVGERCRAVAREGLSLRDIGIPRYDLLYRRLAATSGSGREVR